MFYSNWPFSGLLKGSASLVVYRYCTWRFLELNGPTFYMGIVMLHFRWPLDSWRLWQLHGKHLQTCINIINSLTLSFPTATHTAPPKKKHTAAITHSANGHSELNVFVVPLNFKPSVGLNFRKVGTPIMFLSDSSQNLTQRIHGTNVYFPSFG